MITFKDVALKLRAHLARAQTLLRSVVVGSFGVERLIYRHGSHVICSVLMKRFRNLIDTAEPLDVASIGPVLSYPFDELRQQAADLFQAIAAGSGPLAYFIRQEQTIPFLRDLMKNNYGLVAHPAIAPLDAQHHDDEYPLARLFKFLYQKAPQI